MLVPASAGGRHALATAGVPPQVRQRLLQRPSDHSGYVYALDVVAARARRLRAAVPPPVDVCFATKANSHPDVLRALVQGGIDGFDVASAAELRVAAELRDRHRSDLRVLATGPAKTPALLAELIESGVDVINVESVLELRRLSALAGARDVQVPVALRVNPDRVPVAGSLVMGGTATQFGIAEADVPEAIGLAHHLDGLRLVGFHVHAVCQNLDADAHAAYVRWCVAWSTSMAREHQIDLRMVDVGGGIGVPFHSGDEPFDVERFGADLADLHLPDRVRLVVEPGRWLVTEAGWYAAEVVDVKTAHGETFVLLRGGINHFQLPVSWDIVHNFAVLPVESWPYDFDRPEVVEAVVTVVGELCTTEDTLVRDVWVDRVRVGDLLVFPDAGSYGWEFAMPEFLGHPPAHRHTVGHGTAP
jgi:2-[(L-alanin-3-ylcarbamoyl)methyl]-2-hydroxybutanedioate decarboxylase